MSTTYHPQTDGQTERVNQTLEQYLRCYIDYQKDDWSRLLGPAEFAYNNAAHEGTKETPFFLEYGRHPRAGPTLTKEVHRTDLNDITWNRQQAQEQAKAALKLAAERMKWYYDQGVQKVPFKVGDKVLLDLCDYQTTGRKLNARYLGPYEIVEKLSPVTFKVKWPARMTRIHPVFHASKLIPYADAKISGQKGPTAEPITVDGHEEPDKDSWKPASLLKNSKEAIQEYHKAHPQAICTLDSRQADQTFALLQRDSTLWVELIGGKGPTRRTNDAAGLDLYASRDQVIPSKSRALISTGIKIQLPTGTYGHIAPRSNPIVKDINTIESIIDQDYTGKIQVTLVNTSDLILKINKNDPIAQLIVEQIAVCDVKVTQI
ncbi:hypothetical protein PHLCEN_2v1213 [Hermanssonia centrifuga]|uniref:Deoxyuridine 5'-triphosphate nucleotidohydrolase n=1 Tax=Hermanssonia centrifuga TaxID=98765 RepID=A0A2R6S3S1_9APHY|nr:hypothetical protein PHLCEN_2v1213 [Hermanssonia centrifuga]